MIRGLVVYIVVCAGLFGIHSSAFAESQISSERSYLLASADEGGEAYDPFADYNEFEEATDEEADINFFRNGRFLTLGFYGGYRMFTSIMGEIYGAAPYFGGAVSYFFDLRFAMQVAYITGDHRIKINGGGTSFSGNLTVSQTSFDLKYYLNTQNVTRGLAKFNPYIIGGFSQVYRTTKIDNNGGGYSRDGAIGFQAGFGFEIPMLRNKMFLGGEAVYQYINFPDENAEIVIPASPANVSTGIFMNGDIVRFSGILGINF